ncbi:MAG: YebC/PmpR family DNA-binding transcriptional regulator [Chromatiales bacterium]|jgi:YebC/PmpR family DNA-binding regulatory protein|nr:YebC/PmpR family DNA-binding transcriptional regulator [Chromatiales bacterium]
MAGHSKWANIKHRKGAQDKKRGKIFTRLIREITVAAGMGGGDPAANPRLRLAIDKARADNLPKDTIERAIKRGSGNVDGEAYEEIRYEGYGVGGAAVIVDCLTDNRNRTAADVRHAFSKYGGNLGSDGSVSFLFEHRGVISYPAGADEEAIMEAALEAGAEDVSSNEDGTVDVITGPAAFENIRDGMIAAGHAPENAEVTMRPTTTAELDEDQAVTVLKMLEALEELDDVQDIFSNADFSEEVVARLSG